MSSGHVDQINRIELIRMNVLKGTMERYTTFRKNCKCDVDSNAFIMIFNSTHKTRNC